MAIEQLPKHLQKYVVSQNYDAYTPENHAVWRYILRQLKDYLSTHAHECYAEGLTKTGISLEQIPRIEDIDKKLSEFGWGAVPVSGFIPPAAFMEFQSLGFLPIASDMRTLDHLLYTPAPDIVHEAAGHAPILIHPEFATYLKRYAQIARKSIISKEDMAQYEAIRELSDLKESPEATTAQIQRAEQKLNSITQNMSHISEAARLSRMNWWTAEYGLIGNIKKPKIFGAGLLSSVGEARQCLDEKVKKIPLSIDCINYSYDITEPQPQLFVAEDFSALNDVLDNLAERLAFKRGGAYGLQQALLSQVVNTVELDTGLQISGQLSGFNTPQGSYNLQNAASDPSAIPIFIQFSGPCQLSYNNQELEGHGHNYHSQGYSTPLGLLKGFTTCLSRFQTPDLQKIGLVEGQDCHLEFASGFHVQGKVKQILRHKELILLIAFTDCRVSFQDHIYFEPSWGTFDMAVGLKVPSVYAGPADRACYPETDDFVASRVPSKKYTEKEKQRHKLYEDLKNLRQRPSLQDFKEFKRVQELCTKKFTDDWLPTLELLEIAYKHDLQEEAMALNNHLTELAQRHQQLQGYITDGLRLAPHL